MLRGHGGEIYFLARRLGVPPEKIADHSSNVSPLPPPQGLYPLLKEHLTEIERLPEVDSESLREALAAQFGLDSEQILPGSGTSEWIFAIPRLLKPQKVLVLGPTYSDYADAAQAAGIPVQYVLAKKEENFSPPLKELEKAITLKDLVFICNPNNPTGALIKVELLRELISRYPETYFVIDESYVDFVGEAFSLVKEIKNLPNCLILRSFSKIYRIPGLRLGFLVVSEPLKEIFWQAMLPWAVNRLAQIAGVWLISQKDYVKQVRSFISQEKKTFFEELKALNLPVKLYPSSLHFFLMKLKKHEPQAIWQELLYKHYILVRNASNFYGLEGPFLRLALRSSQENQKLLMALKEVFE
ncbi:pyridoxal phosphate-dependent aminotransferase [Thermodesulfatator autotrophicus]|uniref:Aminotransferase class I/classII large domain-containing protein n=1 Tax=Thermodesulfatator autotrophicus TaxID=1795632 RepID=A0A177E8W1_9BACT|nr:threonine-phosphate decarboxylase [Thermodesulfatator autotrophicus]OAG27449.1 hypothetical protein TH606_06815 [Thermodesulfatator autotrophicus]